MDAVLHKRFASDEIGSSVIRATCGLSCATLLLGIPMLLLAVYLGGVMVLIVLCCMCAMACMFTKAVASNQPGHPFFGAVSCCSCCCVVFLGFLIGFTVLTQFYILPLIEEQLEACCNECTEYCAQHSSALVSFEICPSEGASTVVLPEWTDASNVTTSCSVLPVLRKGQCSSLLGIQVGQEHVPQCAEREYTGCIFPVMCNDVAAPACYATAEQNKFVKAPKDDVPVRTEPFSAGPCQHWKAWTELDFFQNFAVVYAILISSLLGCLVTSVDSRKLSSAHGVIFIPIPVQAPVRPTAPQPLPVVVGAPVSDKRMDEPSAQSEPTPASPGSRQWRYQADASPTEESPSLPTAQLSSASLLVRKKRCQTIILALTCVNVILLLVLAVILFPTVFGLI